MNCFHRSFLSNFLRYTVVSKEHYSLSVSVHEITIVNTLREALQVQHTSTFLYIHAACSHI